MKPGLTALFVHDHIFSLNKEEYVFSSGGLPASTWPRYLRHFSKLTVLGRLDPKKVSVRDEKNLVLSSCSNVSFIFSCSASNLSSLMSRGGAAREKIVKAVRDHDVIIARLSSELGLLAIKEARRQGKPWAIELVDCPWDSYWNYGNYKAKLYAPFISWRVKKAVKNSPYVLYVTKFFLQNRYPSSSSAVTVDCSNVELPYTEDRVITKRTRKIKNIKSKVILGQIGSLKGRFKGIQHAIEAVRLIRDEGFNVELRILGSGDKSPWLVEARKKRVQEFCHFDGALPSGQPVFNWLDEIDVYIHPSLKEGVPRALIEAMSRGCPAIASRVAGTPELLPEDKLVCPKDASGLAEKVINFLEDKESMVNAAIVNFEASKLYSSSILNEKRTVFWKSFSNFSENG